MAKVDPSLIQQTAASYGVDPKYMLGVMRIESGGNPNAKTGSYKGLFQLSNAEFNKYGGGDIFDPADNARAAAAKAAADSAKFQSQFGRAPTATELYMVHQQGVGGAGAHLANPDAPAWQNMASTAEGRQNGDAWSKRAIWGNLPDAVKDSFGNVDSVTSRDLYNVYAGKLGDSPQGATSSAPQSAFSYKGNAMDAAGSPTGAFVDPAGQQTPAPAQVASLPADQGAPAPGQGAFGAPSPAGPNASMFKSPQDFASALFASKTGTGGQQSPSIVGQLGNALTDQSQGQQAQQQQNTGAQAISSMAQANAMLAQRAAAAGQNRQQPTNLFGNTAQVQAPTGAFLQG